MDLAGSDLMDKYAGSQVLEVSSSASRGGRPFTPVAEQDVEPYLRACAGQLRTPKDSLVLAIPECPLPFGVPDLVVVAVDQDALRRRVGSSIAPILAPVEVRLLAACSVRRPTSLPRLVSAAGATSIQTKRLLSRLVQRGALVRGGERWFRNPCVEPVGRLYALEAKVSDWRGGLEQCLRYGAFADATAVVLPEMSDRVRSNATRTFRSLGVGAFVGDAWVAAPRLARLDLARRLLASEHVLAALGQTGVGIAHLHDPRAVG